MCGIAGIIDLRGQREPDAAAVTRMANALWHRGPDDSGFLFAPGIGAGFRRLSIVGLADGRQPIYNEDRSIATLFNGELFEYPEQRADLEAKGHVFRTHTDTEILVHLYEEHGEGVFEHLKGQFAFALFDFRRRRVILARDRFGICPLHWSRQGDWLYFASEIKALIASGAVAPAMDPRGLDHIFNFIALGARRTMFKDVQSLLPGHFLKIDLRGDGKAAAIDERQYWDLDFPDAGDEDNPADASRLADDFDAAFSRAVEIRLRADVPVVGYLSGGIDSATVMATAAKIRGEAPPSFTIRIAHPKLDETERALMAARHIGSRPTVVHADANAIAESYPDLVRAADSPVVDTSCAALFRLSREVRDQGYKVALTGEGSDEAFAGYPWFKIQAFQRLLDVGGFRPSVAASRLMRKATPPHRPFSEFRRIDGMTGGPHAQSDVYNAFALARDAFFSKDLKATLGSYVPYEDLGLPLERMKRWAPLNQSLYLGYKIKLAGLLLNHKGDRVAMANSVETRYPFLDENVVAFCARLHPRWKLRGLLRDKYLLRRMAARYLPPEVTDRPKAMFRAPFAESFLDAPPEYVRQLLSEESLAKTGYFDVVSVRREYDAYVSGRAWKYRFFIGMGLAGVLSTQLWHHLYLGGGLCALPDAGLDAEAKQPTGVAAA